MEGKRRVDSNVVELKRKDGQSPYNILESGVYVNDRLVEFEMLKLFDEKLSIALPKGMKRMGESVALVRYPSDDRPQIIYTNEDNSVNFTFSHFEAPIKPEDTIRAIDRIKCIIRRVYPENVYFEIKEETLGATKLSWFDFKGYTLGGKSYILMYITQLEKKMLHGVFNCRFNDSAEWKKAVLTSMFSIKDLTIKDGGSSLN